MANYDELANFFKGLTDHQLYLAEDILRKEKYSRMSPSKQESMEAEKFMKKWLVQQKLEGKDIEEYRLQVMEYSTEGEEYSIPILTLLEGGTELQDYVDSEPRDYMDIDRELIETVVTFYPDKDTPDEVVKAISKLDISSIGDYFMEQ